MKAAFVVCLLALAGCRTTPLNPALVAPRTALSDVAPLPVRAAPAVWTHTDDFRGAGLPFRNETGRSFVRVFAGTLANQPVIEIEHSTLRAQLTRLGFAAEYVYSVTVRFHHGSKTVRLSATATHTATGFEGPAVAAKIVTEAAIADLAKKVSALL
jgi:hypothetical protein